jgi:hypothetical protein
MNNFTKVKVIGGIGNQLFVLVFGLAISNKLDTKLIVDDSIIHLGSNKSRKMEIANLIFNGFNIEYRRSKLKELLVWHFKFITFLNKIFWKFSKLNRNLIFEDSLSKLQFRFTKGKSFSGYFQDWFYADYIHESNSSFSFDLVDPSINYIDLLNKAKQSKPIFVHVRLGDYLNFPEIYTILPEYYFLDSLNFLNSNGNSEIWLFTENFNQAKKYYPELVKKADKVIDKGGGLSDLESFKLLSTATKLVASNSTFSMWAAWFINKNGFSAVVPIGFGTKDPGYQLADERWDRYDLETRVIIPGSKLSSRYLEKKRDFLSKFE